MTTFKTRYGLFEWLLIPFGLVNAFNIFQKYINWVFRDFFDEPCLTYVDDILIYTDSSRTEYQKQIKKVIKRLQKTGLQLNVSKCKFELTTTKYWGFIIEIIET